MALRVSLHVPELIHQRLSLAHRLLPNPWHGLLWRLSPQLSSSFGFTPLLIPSSMDRQMLRPWRLEETGAQSIKGQQLSPILRLLWAGSYPNQGKW